MTKQTEALKLALEALERNDYLGWQVNKPIITAIREALAEQPAIKFTDKMSIDVPDQPLFQKQPAQQYNATSDSQLMEMPKIGCVNHDCDKCKAQEPVSWVDAGDLKKLRKGDVIRVIRKGETYYSPFRYCGVLEECDYEYYRENSQFVYLEVGMATVEKIVYTRKDCITGAVYADRGDRVEVARATEAKLREKNNG